MGLATESRLWKDKEYVNSLFPEPKLKREFFRVVWMQTVFGRFWFGFGVRDESGDEYITKKEYESLHSRS